MAFVLECLSCLGVLVSIRGPFRLHLAFLRCHATGWAVGSGRADASYALSRFVYFLLRRRGWRAVSADLRAAYRLVKHSFLIIICFQVDYSSYSYLRFQRLIHFLAEANARLKSSYF